MEKEAIAFYTALHPYLADSEATSLIDRIARQELRHVVDLNRELGRLG